MAAARKSLEKRLGDFLGFDDGVADVLDHLLTIDSSSDLLDYLEQLLGSKNDEVKNFVDDVGRFQKGLPIDTGPFGNTEESKVPTPQEKPPPASKKQKQPTTANNSNKNQKQSAKNNAQETAVTKAADNENKKEQKTAKKSPTGGAYNKQQEPAKGNSPPEKDKTIEVDPPQPRKKYAPPPKGEAKRNCGCFGTLHRPLTNCLYCGRIACEDEGYDFCPFCGFLVEEVKPPEGESNSSEAKAWQHKERLLRYDREFSKRTQVFDDQADYYSNQTSTWLTEDERADAEVKDEEQRTDIHTRKKQVLNIAF